MAAAAQISLFAAPAPARIKPAAAPPREVRGLRPYQTAAVDAVVAKLAEHRSTLLVLPTGTGKTFTASTFIERHAAAAPVIWLAHREELVDQGIADLSAVVGEFVAKEKADARAMGGRLVVASVQTLKGDRLEDFKARYARPALIVVDEAHHAVAPSYRKILDAFPDAKVLGLTATPDRADERAMGQVFDSVAFVYEILDAINDGYLCPVVRRRILVDAIDLSGVGTVAGDLNQGQLDTVMSLEKVLHGIAEPLMREAGDRRTILFSTSVENAHRMAEILNRYRPESARALDGSAEMKRSGERGRILRAHKAGEFQFLCNVGVLTEGYDDKAVSCVAIARPTKSRSLYAQMAGRGLRILDGKRDCLLLDFVGRNGGHKLATALDILGGRYDEATVARARDIMENGDTAEAGIDPKHALELAAKEIAEAKAREAAKRAAIKARVNYRVEDADPFDVLHMRRIPDAGARFGMTATEPQIKVLQAAGIPVPDDLSRQQASQLIGSIHKRRQLGLCTFKQLRVLQRHGITDVNIGFKRASALITALDRGASASVLMGQAREPGADDGDEVY